jgi:hypothetical protein
MSPPTRQGRPTGRPHQTAAAKLNDHPEHTPAVRQRASSLADEIAWHTGAGERLRLRFRPAFEPCPETVAHFVDRDVKRMGRVRAHVQRLRDEARRLGRDVGRYERTHAEAMARLAVLCDLRDTEIADLADVRLVPWHDARAITTSCFEDALAREQRRQVRSAAA